MITASEDICTVKRTHIMPALPPELLRSNPMSLVRAAAKDRMMVTMRQVEPIQKS